MALTEQIIQRSVDGQRAVVPALAAAGARVSLLGRDESRLTKVSGELGDAGRAIRVSDVADQLVPCEMGYSEPVFGGPSSPSNDDDVDNRGLIYLADRNVGFDILELRH